VQVGDRLGGGWAGFGGADNARDFAAGHLAAITEAAKRENLSPAFLLAVIAVESAGKTKARSPKGAQGLMQLMPATARRFDVANPWDATENIAGGAAYLNFLLEHFGEDPVLALAGYNAGEGAVEKYSGVPPYSETRDYVPKVLAAFLAVRGLCIVPPVNVRDECVLFLES
jgi:soluble lytic murein transglycosylase-like protein